MRAPVDVRIPAGRLLVPVAIPVALAALFACVHLPGGVVLGLAAYGAMALAIPAVILGPVQLRELLHS
jgi:hypothetical protein